MHCRAEAVLTYFGGEGVHVMEAAVIGICGDVVDISHIGKLPRREDEQLSHLAELMTSLLGMPALAYGFFLQMDKREGFLYAIFDQLLLAFRDTRCDQHGTIFSRLNPCGAFALERVGGLIAGIKVALIAVHQPTMAEDLFFPRALEQKEIAIYSEVLSVDGDVLAALEQIGIHSTHDSPTRVVLDIVDDVLQLTFAVTDGIVVVVVKKGLYTMLGVIGLALFAGGMGEVVAIYVSIRHTWRIQRTIRLCTAHFEAADDLTKRNVQGTLYLEDTMEMVGHDLIAQRADLTAAGGLYLKGL